MLRKVWIFVAAIGVAVIAAQAAPSDYQRIARISYLDGHVSFQHPNEVDWTAASVNMALQPGDRIYSGEDGRVDIEIDDGSVLHLAEKTDIEILSLRDDLIQIRQMIGLFTLTLHSSISFEISTPAAAFNPVRKGVYRFDVVESGDTDAIVRKGMLEAASSAFSDRIESGELIHMTPGPESTNVVSAYDRRDPWDEWTDRRDADLVAYDSRKYLPDSVYMGVSELDTFGRWVVVDSYGPAWIPNNVDADWSPYWVGRWWYRPAWGWTWVSYEPWGWLPYHYGRWYHHTSFGWCWLPGISFGFHFWSPGLVRFYQGPSWVSWCPLGPGDYYNVNNLYYNPSYNYHLNNLRMTQLRGPGDLVNRNVPGAFRTVSADNFVARSFGSRGGNSTVSSFTQQPWQDGRLVTDRLSLPPTSRSYAPAPDRPVVQPSARRSMPSVVRNEPVVEPSGGRNSLVRIGPSSVSIPASGEFGRNPASPVRSGSSTNAGANPGRGGNNVERSGSAAGEFTGSRPAQGSGRAGQINRTAPPVSNETAPANSARETSRAGTAQRDAAGRAPTAPPSSGSSVASPGRSDKPAPAPSNPRTDSNSPRRMESTPAPAPRNDKPAPAPERTKPPERQRPEESYSYRSYSTPNTAPNAGEGRAVTAPAQQTRSWQPAFAVRQVPGSYAEGNRTYQGSYSAPPSPTPRSMGSSAPQNSRSSSSGNSRRRN